MRLVTREQWGARPSKGVTRLSATRGVKVHYVGSHVPKNIPHSACDALVRQIQKSHMDGNGWNDIGYSLLTCNHGFNFMGRGPHVLPAANGEGLNTAHYAICGLVGSSGQTHPSDAMLNGIRDGIEYLRRTGMAGNEIKGHRDGYATECPGEFLYAWVRDGAPRIGDDDMDPTTQVQVGTAWDQAFDKAHYQAGYLWVETLARARAANEKLDNLTDNVVQLTSAVNVLVAKINALQ